MRIKYKNHFKRKNKIKNTIIDSIIILAMIIVLILLLKNYIDSKQIANYAYNNNLNKQEEEVLEKANLKAEADIDKSVLEVKAETADRFITSVNSEIEYVVMTEEGEYSVSHERTDDAANWFTKTFKKSNIKINFTYKAVMSIDTNDITIYNQNGTVYIDYDLSKIKVKSIEVSDGATKSESAVFGKKYSNQDVIALIEIAKDQLYDKLNESSDIKNQSSTNLDNYFVDMATKMKLGELVINKEKMVDNSYTFLNIGTVKHNHSNKALENVEYIVIHSTGVNNLSALQYYNNLNSYIQKRKASAHFYVDYENVVQAIPTNLQSWNCGTKEPKIQCNNSNSIGVEICQYDDESKQEEAIGNAVQFVKAVLLKEFPNAKIVMHREVSNTDCPSILTDDRFEELFKQ